MLENYGRRHNKSCACSLLNFRKLYCLQEDPRDDVSKAEDCNWEIAYSCWLGCKPWTAFGQMNQILGSGVKGMGTSFILQEQWEVPVETFHATHTLSHLVLVMWRLANTLAAKLKLHLDMVWSHVHLGSLHLLCIRVSFVVTAQDYCDTLQWSFKIWWGFERKTALKAEKIRPQDGWCNWFWLCCFQS